MIYEHKSDKYTSKERNVYVYLPVSRHTKWHSHPDLLSACCYILYLG